MSSTRRAAPGAPLHQGRYSSSATYEHGLLGNVVAMRCKVLKNPQTRTLIFFLQQLSHQEGGLERVAEDLIAMFPERVGTTSMHRFGRRAKQRYTPEEMKLIAPELPLQVTCFQTMTFEEPPNEAQQLVEMCLAQANSLIGLFTEICLDPSVDPDVDLALGATRRGIKKGVTVWWFDNIWGALQEFRQRHIDAASKEIVSTTITRKIFEDLDYAHYGRGFVVIEGEQRTGKSISSRNWCARHPGEAIYVKLESGMDDTTFFRSISRALGTACSLQRKTIDMRMRIEDTLQEGHRTLVLDEAHFLWPQVSRPRSAPSRIDWLRTALVDHGVGVALISTPQFEKRCQLFEKALMWNAKQLTGRLKLHTVLPSDLPEEDLMAVARHMAPEADEVTLLRLVGFAQVSDDYLAGIERLVSRAAFFAHREGRSKGNRSDISKALDEAMPRQISAETLPVSLPRKRAGNAHALPLQGHRKPVAALPEISRSLSPSNVLPAADPSEFATQLELSQH